MKIYNITMLTRQNSVVFQNNLDNESKPYLPVRPDRNHRFKSTTSPLPDTARTSAVTSPIEPVTVQVTGITHLVAAVHGSLMASQKEIQVFHQDIVRINTKNRLISRRGPNQEIYDQIDLRNKHEYQWFEVLYVNDTPLTEEAYYIREDTFMSLNCEHIQDQTISHSPSYRTRRSMSLIYDFPYVSRHQQYSLNAIDCLKSAFTELKNKNGKHCSDIKKIINDFRNQLCLHLGGTFISCLYGSYATGSQNSNSDIDILFSCDNQTYSLYHQELLPILRDFVAYLHHAVDARVDDEVPAESKLIINAQEFMEAASGKIYYPNIQNKTPCVHSLAYFLEKKIDINDVKKSESRRFSDSFLSSKYLRMRLLFNILTTPHDLHSNQEDAPKQLLKEAINTLRILSNDLKISPIDSQDATTNHFTTEHLFKDVQGNSGEMYLGYKADRPFVKDHLTQLLAQAEYNHHQLYKNNFAIIA